MTTLFLFLFLFSNTQAQSETSHIIKFLEPNKVLVAPHKIIKLDLIKPAPPKCHKRLIMKQLNHNFNQQAIKLKPSPNNPDTYLIYGSQENINLTLIKKGLAVPIIPTKKSNYYYEIQKALKNLKKNPKGYHITCSHQKAAKSIHETKTKQFRLNKHPYAKDTSFKSLIKQTDNLKVITHKNLKLNLTGISSPPEHSAFSKCFKPLQNKYIASKLKYKSPIIQKDRLKIDTKYLPRHFFINNQHLNHAIIKDGYAFLDQEKHQFSKIFKKSQINQFKNPKGAWAYCAKYLKP